MMNARQLLLIATASATTLSINLAATPSQAETLADVIAYAYDTNPGLQAQRAAVRAVDESYVQARSGYGLNVNATAGATSYESRRNFNLGKADAETESYGLSFVQPLYTGGRVRARLTEAQAQIQSAREQLRRYEMDVLQRVVAAYVGVRRDEQLLKIAQENVALLERGLSDTKSKYDVQMVTITDLAQSRARLAQSRTLLFSAQEQLAASRSQFLATVGQNPRQLEPPPALELIPADIDKAFEAAEGNNPQLLGARFTEEGSRARIARAKANGLPTITARADFQRGPYQPFDARIYENRQTASVTFSQPLFAAGQIQSGVRQATEENNRDRLTVDEVRLQVIQGVTQAWERLVTLRQQMSTLQDEVKANELAFLGVRAEERYSLRSNIEILNAAAELNAAQQNLARTQAAEYIGRVQLLALTGTLSPQVLSANVDHYDPARNYKRVKNTGVTPLDLPVMVLDRIASPSIDKPRSASIAEATPGGSTMPATPGPQRPITSVLEIVKKDPTATTLPNP